MDHWADVAAIVKDRRAELSMTQHELATRSGVSTATLRKIESGDSQQRQRSTLTNLSRALGLSEDHLWRVSRGESPTGAPEGELSALRAEVADLVRRVEALESRSSAASDR